MKSQYLQALCIALALTAGTTWAAGQPGYFPSTRIGNGGTPSMPAKGPAPPAAPPVLNVPIEREAVRIDHQDTRASRVHGSATTAGPVSGNPYVGVSSTVYGGTAPGTDVAVPAGSGSGRSNTSLDVGVRIPIGN